MSRNCCAQNLTDHWIETAILILKGLTPKTESDGCGLGRVILGILEAAEDVIEEVSIKTSQKYFPKAAGAVDFQSAGWRNRQVKKTAEHLEAERNLRGIFGEELKMATRNLAKQRRKYRAKRIIQSLQKEKNQNVVCSTLYCDGMNE